MNTVIEYIWLDANGMPRSKTRYLSYDGVKLPEWNFDGSSTGQATGDNSEVIIRPNTVYQNPFMKGASRNLHETQYLMTVCDCYTADGEPHPTNTRHQANKLFEQRPELKPMFGMEQEFFLEHPEYDVEKLLADKAQGDYYCGVGAGNAIGRDCVELAFNYCIQAGIPVTGLNGEVAPLQWEIQVCSNGIRAGDDLTVMRYILMRTAERMGFRVNFHPKPHTGDCNGSGCHVNFSTAPMRASGGYAVIKEAIAKLGRKHEEHMKHYGTGNELRMTGEHETCSYNEFRSGVADRGASIRIPTDTEKTDCGYFEDRRPASNMDPYLVTSMIYQTTSL